MPLHPDFQKILESFKEEYGEEEGERRFYAWLRSRGYDETKSMAWNLRREAELSIAYTASISPLEAEKAEIYVIDTTLNGNRWMVTEEALKKALETLKGAPLLGPPEQGHRSNSAVGFFQDYRLDPGGAVYGIAEITDPEAWEAIKSGRWRYVSPRIIARHVDYSPTGAAIVRDFLFDHVAFVEKPAYPRAGVHELLASHSEAGANPYCGFSQALEAALQVQVGASPCSRSPETGDNQASSEAKEMGKDSDPNSEGGVLPEPGSESQPRLEAGAVAGHQPPKADKDRSWDGDAAVQRLRQWAGGPDKDKVDWARYAEGFAWVDPERRDDYAGYKLPHHDVVDGRLVTVWRGVAAAMAALLGARGGVDIPVDDRRAVYNHLAGHYRQFEEEPPELHGGVEEKMAEMEREEARGEDLKALEAEIEKLKEENRELRELVAKLEEERLEAELNALNEKRGEVGLEPIAKEAYLKLSAEARQVLRADLEKVSKRMTEISVKPKARFSASTGEDLVESVRERLFGYRKGKN